LPSRRKCTKDSGGKVLFFCPPAGLGCGNSGRFDLDQ
jgi:hypothetical protein